MNQPLVSILITLYNRERYVAESIKSVINLKYANWELIIVDDQSTDRSVQIAKDYEKQNSRIKIYRNEQNLGDYKNRNKAASYAKGKYLKYLDADDVIYPYTLDIMVDVMEKNSDAAAGIAFNRIDDKQPYPQKLTPTEAYRMYFMENRLFGTGPSGAIIRRSVFEKLEGFKPIRHEGDNELWLRIAAQYSIVKLQPALVWWKVHEGQENKKRKNLNLSYYTNLNALISEHCPLSPVEVKRAIEKLNYRCARNIIHMALKKWWLKIAIQEIKKSNLGLKTYIKSWL